MWEDEKKLKIDLNKQKKVEEQWDERCKKAVHLFHQGISYPNIAKNVGCKVSNLYRELKKRGLLQMPKEKNLSEPLKSNKISTTKKSKFERYKKFYMYK